jgi:hypothetical protein
MLGSCLVDRIESSRRRSSARRELANGPLEISNLARELLDGSSDISDEIQSVVPRRLNGSRHSQSWALTSTNPFKRMWVNS